jgi:malonyl-CoA decarboxylase
VDLGNFLIKEVAKALRRDLPQIDTYSTLSPIPNFVPWLESQRHNSALLRVDDVHVQALKRGMETKAVTVPSSSRGATGVSVVLDALATEQWHEDADLVALLEPILLKLGARYVYHEKKRGKALCQVANFHIRNGAIFERINWLADPSAKVCTRGERTMFVLCMTDEIFSLGLPPKRWHDGELQVRSLVR